MSLRQVAGAIAHTRGFGTGPPVRRPRPLIARFPPGSTLPFELARVQSGRHVRLRDHGTQQKYGRLSFDLKLKEDGLVHPATGNMFTGPNGASFRPPLSPTFQEIVRNFYAPDVVVFVIKEGAVLPDTLTLLHEHSDHYSIQCTSPMPLQALDRELTKFILYNARELSPHEFTEEYPFSAEF